MESPLPAVLEEENEETQKENPNKAWTEELPLPPPALEGENESPPVSESAGSLSPVEGSSRTPEKNDNADEVQSERRVTPSSLLSRRSKSKSIGSLCVDTGRKEQKHGETRQEVVRNKETHSRTLLTELDDDDEEEEVFVSDKENMTPYSSTAQKLKRNCIETQGNWTSDKENWTPEVPMIIGGRVQETCVSDNTTPGGVSGVRRSKKPSSRREQPTERRKERVPFQTLLENSPSRNKSPVSHRERLPLQSPVEKSPLGNNAIPVNYAQALLADEGNMNSSPSHNQTGINELHNSSEAKLHKEEEKESKWNMVVDVDCLLNEESRKSLQLLEGLKGTHLIIPRIVIRELDCEKRRGSRLLFRRETNAAAAAAALRWIEECMAKFGWWIHVQTSSETLPVPPTPPATPPRSQLGDGGGETGAGAPSSTAFSTCGSLTEILSPTAEDHVLDCALLFTRAKDDEQLLVLSNSVTLKIKAMAEGLMCETPKEFRTSLVNPYSKRFLWSTSSPRGPTWSCLDEAALIENYYQQFPPLRRMEEKPTDVVKGLKLILLHNSHYGKTNLVE